METEVKRRRETKRQPRDVCFLDFLYTSIAKRRTTETPPHYLSSFEGASTRTPARGVLAQTRVAPRRRRDRRPSSVGGGAMAPASRAREAERALLHSVRCGSFADVRNALDVVDAVPGASVDARGFADVTPLHAAAWRGDASIARLIVDAGASLVARDAESGWTPLHRAMHHGAFAVAAVLLEHGANPRAPKDDAGRSPLDVLSNALCRARAVAASEDPRDASRSVRDRPSRGGPPPPPPPRRLLAPWICTRGAAA